MSSDARSAGHLIAALEAAGKYDIFWSNEHFYCWLNAIPLAYTALRPITTMDRRFTIRIDDAAGISEKLAFLYWLARDGRFPGAAVAAARRLANRGKLKEALGLSRKAREMTKKVMGVFGFTLSITRSRPWSVP